MGKKQRKAFELSKSALQSANLLLQIDPEKELTLSCDASPHGVGAVLSHHHGDGTENQLHLLPGLSLRLNGATHG